MVNNLTPQDLETIMHWGMDRAEAIGVINFMGEGGDKVYLKIRKILCPELYEDVEASPVSKTGDAPAL